MLDPYVKPLSSGSVMPWLTADRIVTTNSLSQLATPSSISTPQSLTLSGTATATVAGLLTAQSGLSVSSNAAVSGTATVTGLLTAQAGLSVSSNAAISGTATVTGLLTASSAMTVASTVTLSLQTASRILTTSSTSTVASPSAISTTQSLSLTNASGIQTQQAATQDAMRLLGRAGGTSSYIGTLTPTTLTASRTWTFPDAAMVVSGSASALTSGRIPFVTTGGLLLDDPAFDRQLGGAFAYFRFIISGVTTVVGSTSSAGFMGTESANDYELRCNNLAFATMNGTTLANGKMTINCTTTSTTLTSNALDLRGGIGIADAKNINVGSTTGCKIGTATTQKLSLWDATPIVQPSSTGETTGWTSGGGSAATSTDTYTGNVGTKAYTVNDLVKHMKAFGVLATS